MPANLPAVWARLGKVGHAIALARSIPGGARRGAALAGIAEAELSKNNDLAASLLGEAEAAARVSANHEASSPVDKVAWLQEKYPWAEFRNVDTVPQMHRFLTAIQARLDNAYAGTIINADPMVSIADQALALSARAEIMLRIGSESAQDMIQRAQRAAYLIAEPMERAQVRCAMAEGLADIDPERVRALAGLVAGDLAEVEDTDRVVSKYDWISRSLMQAGLWDAAADAIRLIPETGRLGYQMARFEELVESVSAFDPDWAVELAVEATEASKALAGYPSMPNELVPLLDEARNQCALWDRTEQAAMTIPSTELKIRALNAMAALNPHPDSVRARRIRGAAEALAAAGPPAATDSQADILALTALADAIAERLSEPAAGLPGESPDRNWHRLPPALAKSLVVALTASRTWDSAEHAVRSIANRRIRMEALFELAVGMRTADPDESARLFEEYDKMQTRLHAPLGIHIEISHGRRRSGTPELAIAEHIYQHPVSTAEQITQPGVRAISFAAMAVLAAPVAPAYASLLVRRAISSTAESSDPAAQPAVTAAQRLALAKIAVIMGQADAQDTPLAKARKAAAPHHYPQFESVILAFLATAVAPASHEQAAEMWHRAEATARSIRNQMHAAPSLASIATTLQPVDPHRAIVLADQALGMAKSISSPTDRAASLTDIADILISTDPGGACRLAQSAEHTARLSADPGIPGYPRIQLMAEALAAADEYDEQKISAGGDQEDNALLCLASGLAAGDHSERAMQVTRAIGMRYFRSWAMEETARAFARQNKWQLAQQAADDAGRCRAPALAYMALCLAESDHTQATNMAAKSESEAYRQPDDYWKCIAVLDSARILAAFDLKRAGNMVEYVVNGGCGNLVGYEQFKLVTALAAVNELDRAEHLAQEITDPELRADAESRLAAELASTGRLEAAQRYACSIDSSCSTSKVWALAAVARELADVDQRQAADLIRQAEELADGAERPYKRGEILCAAAEALLGCRSDRPSRRPIADRVHSLARRLTARTLVEGEWRTASDALGTLEPEAVAAIHDRLLSIASNAAEMPANG
jgi:hypothetical protein